MIIELPDNVGVSPIQLPTKFTKLSIRRCLRQHGLEGQLDAILTGNVDFAKDWR